MVSIRHRVPIESTSPMYYGEIKAHRNVTLSTEVVDLDPLIPAQDAGCRMKVRFVESVRSPQ